MRDPLDDLIDKVRQVIDQAVKASQAVVQEELVSLGGHEFTITPLAAGAAESE